LFEKAYIVIILNFILLCIEDYMKLALAHNLATNYPYIIIF